MQGPRLRLLLATVLGAVLVFVLAGLLYLTAGLIVVAGVVGWGTAVAVRRDATPRADRLLAVGGTLVALTLGLVGAWAMGVSSGGTLGPLEFVVDVFGVLAPLIYVVGAAAAWWASRGDAQDGVPGRPADAPRR